MQVFAPLPPGEQMTATEIVEGLLHRGYDFGPIAEEPARRISLTKQTLARLVANGTLTVGNLGAQRTWQRPVPPQSDPPAAVGDTTTPAMRPGVKAAFVFTVSFLVILYGVTIVIGLIRTW